MLRTLLLLSFISLQTHEATEPWSGTEEGDTQTTKAIVELWFFWSRHCPHCKEAHSPPNSLGLLMQRLVLVAQSSHSPPHHFLPLSEADLLLREMLGGSVFT